VAAKKQRVRIPKASFHRVAVLGFFGPVGSWLPTRATVYAAGVIRLELEGIMSLRLAEIIRATGTEVSHPQTCARVGWSGPPAAHIRSS